MKSRIIALALAASLLVIGPAKALADDDNIPPVWLLLNLDSGTPLKVEMKDMETCAYFIMQRLWRDDKVTYANERKLNYVKENFEEMVNMSVEAFAETQSFASTKYGTCLKTSTK